MKNKIILFLIFLILTMGLGISCPERLPVTHWDPLRGRILDENQSPILGVKAVAAPFIGTTTYETSGDSAYSDMDGVFKLEEGFPTEYYQSITCATESVAKDWIDFYVILFHADYDTTVALFSKQTPADIYLQQTAGFIDTLIIGSNTYGEFKSEHVIPPIIMKPKP